jgi:hypothetical protein
MSDKNMPIIHAKADNLNEINNNFLQKRLAHPIFLNSVPKCGTHLIRNIFRMFVPVEQQYHDAFIQSAILHQDIAAFSKEKPRLSWGHLFFSDESSYVMHKVNQIVVVRDPYDWVLARTRFFLSDSFDGELEHLKSKEFTIEQIYNMMIFGIYKKAPNLHEIFTHNAVSWLGTDTKLVHFEDIIKHLNDIESSESKTYFKKLLGFGGIKLTEDWIERIRIGSDRKQSGTARENLYGNQVSLPKKLPKIQQELVDYAAPGLRRLLGYKDYD